jgi:hypothetical protein
VLKQVADGDGLFVYKSKRVRACLDQFVSS